MITTLAGREKGIRERDRSMFTEKELRSNEVMGEEEEDKNSVESRVREIVSGQLGPALRDLASQVENEEAALNVSSNISETLVFVLSMNILCKYVHSTLQQHDTSSPPPLFPHKPSLSIYISYPTLSYSTLSYSTLSYSTLFIHYVC